MVHSTRWRVYVELFKIFETFETHETFDRENDSQLLATIDSK